MKKSSSIATKWKVRVLYLFAITLFSMFANTLRAETGKPLTAGEIDSLLVKQTGKFNTITKTDSGAHITCPMQAIEAEISKNEFKLFSTTEKDGKGFFSIKVHNFGKKPVWNSNSLENALIDVSPKLVKVITNKLSQEFTTKYDGIRQDFILNSRPEGKGSLVLNLDLLDAKAELSERGVKITMGNGREFVYGKLMVTDATGKKLSANFDVTDENKISIVVQDQNAVYPVRIDPTMTDANWELLGGGVSGDNSKVLCAAVDSTGILYVGGDFTRAGNTGNTRYLAQWGISPVSGNLEWMAVGLGVNNVVYAMDVDDADNLYIGGTFTKAGNAKVGDLQVNHIAKWGNDPLLWTSTNDGTWRATKWRALQTGTNGPVYAIAADKDGVVNISKSDQDAVYFGGDFTSPSLGNITRWEYTFDAAGPTVTAKFSGLKSGVDGTVWALNVDSGNHLYVGGEFDNAWDGTTLYPNTARLARWTYVPLDPTTSDWSSVGVLTGTAVYTIAIDSADVVYVGGDFGGVGANAASYNGAWTNLTSPGDVVLAMAVDSGDNIYAGGNFGVMTHNGAAWVALGGGQVGNPVNALAIDLNTDDIYAGGQFYDTLSPIPVFGDALAADVPARNIAVYTGGAWNALQQVDPVTHVAIGLPGVGPDYNNNVNAITYYCGSKLKPFGGIYIGGAFTMVDGVEAKYVAKWSVDDAAWTAVGEGLNGEVGAMVYEGGVLYVGGAFTMAGKVDAMHMAKYWNDPNDNPNMGVQWGSMGNVLTATEVDGGYDFVEDIPVVVTAMCADNDGNIYAGGSFTTPGQYVAKFAGGGSGSAMGSGVGAALDETPFVYALTCDSSNNIYIGGGFTEPAPYLTKWSGSYSDIGGNFNRAVLALHVDSVDNLYVGGSFTSSVVTSPYIAKYDIGLSTWSAMGNEIDGPVFDISVDSADFVYAAGDFSFDSGDPTYVKCNNIAQWDNTGTWKPVASGVGGGNANQQVWALCYNPSAGRLFVGGAFDTFKTYTVPTAVNRVACCVLKYVIQFEVAPYYGTTIQYNGILSPATRIGGHHYLVGDQIQGPDDNFYQCSVEGISDTVVPAIWNDPTVDGGVTWDRYVPANEAVANSTISLWQYVAPGGVCDPVTAVPDETSADGWEYFLSYWTGVKVVGKCGGTPCIGPWEDNSLVYNEAGPPPNISGSATIKAHFGRMIYVNKSAAGLNNGKTWADAFTDFQNALSAANPYDMIWVAKGTYYPSDAGDRSATFTLKKFLRVYGGFAGNETLNWAEKRSSAALATLLNNRQVDQNKTVLSGDVTVDKTDADYTDNPTDNSYHIVTGPGFSYDGTQASVDAASEDDQIEEVIASRLDGFTVEGGYANGSGTLGKGAGAFLKSIPVTFEYCSFKNNYALAGGAVYASNQYLDTSPCYQVMPCPSTSLTLITRFPNEMINCLFSNNLANTGGAIAALKANIDFYLCTFGVNNADIGGAVVFDNYPASPNGTKYCPYNIVTSSIFYSNKSTDVGTYDNIALKNSAQVEISYSNIVEPKAGAGFVYGGTGNLAVDPYYVSSGSTGSWTALTEYQPGDTINVGPLKKKYVCIQLGTTGAAQPDWTVDAPNIGNSLTDGSVIWQYQAWDLTIDLHLQSSAGHYTTNGWVYDNLTSPSIDKANPAYGVGNEPVPNGGLCNMGAYGLTIEASKTWDVSPNPAAAIVVTQPNSSNYGPQGLIFDGITGRTYEIKVLSQGGANTNQTLTLNRTSTGVIGVITPSAGPVVTNLGSGRFVSTYTWNIDNDNIGGAPPALNFGSDYFIHADDGGGRTHDGSEFTINVAYNITFNTDGTATAEIWDAQDNPLALPYVQNVLSGDDTAPMKAYIPAGATKFVNWTYTDPVTGAVTTTDNPLTITVTGNIVDVVAHFGGPLTLTVNNGTASNATPYESEQVTITADAAPAGQSFAGWAWVTQAGATVANMAASPTTLTMGAGPVTEITATYAANAAHQLTQHDGCAVNPGADIITNPSEGAQVTITAPNHDADHYHFTNWTLDVNPGGTTITSSVTSPTTLTMGTANTEITAHYAANSSYSLTVVNGVASVTPGPAPGGKYYAYETYQIVANAAPAGQYFTGWTTPDGGTFANASLATTNYTMPDKAATVTANYAALPILTVVNGNGDGAFPAGTVTPITGTGAGYFVNWTSDAGGVFASSTTENTNFTMPGNDVTVTANYTANPTLTVTNGTGDGQYAAATVVNITADAPPNGSYFSGWTQTPVAGGVNGVFGDATASSTTFTMPDNSITVTANYTANPTLTVVDGSPAGPTSTSPGATITITAIADSVNNGYFQYWRVTKLNNVVVNITTGITDPDARTTTYTMPDVNAEVTAEFTPEPTLTVVNGTDLDAPPDTHAVGAVVNIQGVAPFGGMHFVSWSTNDGGSFASAGTEGPTTYTMPANKATITANYVWYLTYTAGANGTITGSTSQQVANGADGTAVTARPNPGYLFVNWSDASVVNPRTDTAVGADIAVTANFAVDPTIDGVLALGTALTVLPADIPGMDAQFGSRPNIYGTFTDPFTAKVINASTKGVTLIPASYLCEWIRSVCLYDKKALKDAVKQGTTTDTWLDENYIDSLACTVSAKVRTANGTLINSPLTNSSYLIAPPQVTSITGWDGNAIAAGVHLNSIIIVNGNYFGKKLPNVSLEYTDIKGLVKQKRLKVVKEYAYADAKGTANASCMNVTTGVSQFKVQMPNKWWRDWGTRENLLMVMDNKLGIAVFDVPTIPAGQNTAPTANADAAAISISAASSCTIDVTANDTDPEADYLTVTVGNQERKMTSNRNGKVSVYQKTQIKYTPDKKQGSGYTDTFSYTVNDGHGGTSSSTVTVTVNP